MNLFWAFLTHFVADFLLQSRKMGKNKSSSVKWLAGHIAIIFLCFLPFGLKFAALNALFHAIIDGTIWNLYKLLKFYQWYSPRLGLEFNCKIAKERAKKFKYWEDHWFYVTIGLDQFLHGATIILLMRYL